MHEILGSRTSVHYRTAGFYFVLYRCTYTHTHTHTHAQAEALLGRKLTTATEVDTHTHTHTQAEALLGRKLTTATEVEAGAAELLATGPASVLIKGGHSMKGEDDEDGASQDFWTDGQSSW